MPAENDLGDWFRSIPVVTRWWFLLSIAFTLLGRFGVLNIIYMFLNFDLVVYKFQIWRLFTSIVFYPLTPQTGFHYLINLYFLYSYSKRLESGLFDGRPADHLFMLLFNSIILIIIGFLINLFTISLFNKRVLPFDGLIDVMSVVGLPTLLFYSNTRHYILLVKKRMLTSAQLFLMDPLVLSVLYIWCQINKDTIVTFWFGMQFKAMYLPWVLAIFNMVVGGGGLKEIIGIFVGHLYFFLMFKYPQDFGGTRFISTPALLYKLLPNRRGGVSGFGMPPASRRAVDGGAGGGRHPWGEGRRLDADN